MQKYTKYNQASLLLHGLVDNLDDSHFTYDKEAGRLEFNVGKVARNSKFSHIDFIIVRGETQSIKPAKRKSSDNYIVVVSTSNFPDIKDVDSFIESSDRSIDIIKALAEIIRVAPPENTEDDSSSQTSYEKEKRFNDREVFEEVYQKAVKRMMDKLKQFQKTKLDFQKKIDGSGIASRKATYKLALQNVKKDAIGDNASQFKSIFMKVLDEVEPEFADNLDADNKKRLNSRIEQFYSEIS